MSKENLPVINSTDWKNNWEKENPIDLTKITKKYEELKAKQQSCRDANAALKSVNQDLEEKNNELTASINSLQKQLADMKSEVETKRIDR